MRTIFTCSVVLGLAATAGCGGGTVDPSTDTGTRDAATQLDSGGNRGDTGLDAASGTDAASGIDTGAAIDSGNDGGAISANDGGQDAAVVSRDAGNDAQRPDTGLDAGGACMSDTDCTSSGTTHMYCQFRVGTCGGSGVCTAAGGVCSGAISTRVCGCDGTTYNNESCARQAGTSVRNPTGPCAAHGCCTADGDCGDNQECVPAGATGGQCKDKVREPMCWRDSDCADGATCEGESVCQCGVLCIIADHAGTCASTH